MPASQGKYPRCVALVGPYLSGKTTLLESLLAVTNATHRKGTVKDGTTVGDSAPEARAHQMSVEVSVASAEYLGDKWTFIDCPGSIEFAQEARNALNVVDAAVVVCEPDMSKTLTLAPILKYLDEHQIPHMLFINKMDQAPGSVAEILGALQQVSDRPLVLRQVPIREDDKITGYVDLVSERAYLYRPDQPSDRVAIPKSIAERERQERTRLLESLADFDDALLEKLLEDSLPSKEEVYGDLTRTLSRDMIVPVFLGGALHDHGVRRLLKALRHEVPGVESTAERLGLDGGEGPFALVFKTLHVPHVGKLSLTRIWRGEVAEGMTLGGERVGGVAHLTGQTQAKLAKAGPGDIVALLRMDSLKTGDRLTAAARTTDGKGPSFAPMAPVFSAAVAVENRNDEVKLTGALAKLVEEDPSLAVEQSMDTHELVLWGQGEMHLRIAFERLKSKYNLAATAHRPQVPYQETIRKSTSQHGRYKRQTGGHGQFGDVHIDIKPLPRGTGFTFTNTVVGGAVPRQFIPAVEAGVREYLKRGPFGFPVVDVAVTLTDGQYHSVDSSEQAFKQASRIAMTEGMANCDPVLLEPIFLVTVRVPSEFTSKAQRLISGRRGQILGYGPIEGWKDWDEVQAYLPQSEMHDLIIELRSLTLGVGNFAWKLDHLQELTGRLADQVVAQRAQKMAAAS
ncbi:MAG: elongation factor G [Alphaproteobacteria bacterium]